MPVTAGTAARRARYLIPMDTPRRGEIIAAFAIAVLVAHLLFAQLTIAVTAALFAVGRISRWRPQWLAVPAGAGLVWVLAIGPAAALAGFADGARQVAGYLAKIALHPASMAHLGTVSGSPGFGSLGHWLARQLPLALIAASGEAAAAWWLRWLHTDEQESPRPRPGRITLVGWQLRAASVAAGGVVTRDGACLGIAAGTGDRVAVSWP